MRPRSVSKRPGILTRVFSKYQKKFHRARSQASDINLDDEDYIEQEFQRLNQHFCGLGISQEFMLEMRDVFHQFDKVSIINLNWQSRSPWVHLYHILCYSLVSTLYSIPLVYTLKLGSKIHIICQTFVPQLVCWYCRTTMATSVPGSWPQFSDATAVILASRRCLPWWPWWTSITMERLTFLSLSSWCTTILDTQTLSTK